MIMKGSQEWSIDAPWGKIAMISWGSSSAQAVLMVHGYMDSAATSSHLVEHLTDQCYYVPGHGKSDALPPGPLIGQEHMVEPLRRVVEHMGWKSFVYVGHSMGIIIGCIYNIVYPGRMTGMVCLDPGPALTPQYEVNHNPPLWYKRYSYHYEHNYNKSTSDEPKLYEYKKIISSVSRNRKLTNQQAEIVLSRSLVKPGRTL